MYSTEVKAVIDFEEPVNTAHLESLAESKLDLEGYDLSNDWSVLVLTQQETAKHIIMEVYAETTKDVDAIAERVEEWIKDIYSVEDINTTTKEWSNV